MGLPKLIIAALESKFLISENVSKVRLNLELFKKRDPPLQFCSGHHFFKKDLLSHLALFTTGRSNTVNSSTDLGCVTKS